MAPRVHDYTIQVRWTGDLGTGTRDYRSYSRRHDIQAAGKPVIDGSSDPAFRGDAERWNPEELLTAAVSACHKLWYLHLCAVAGVVVRRYEDRAQGTMVEEADGTGRFSRVVLCPRVQVETAAQVAAAVELHHAAHAMCFIAQSVKFPIDLRPEVTVFATA